MPSKKPRDLAGVTCAPTVAASVERHVLNLGTFTANTTVAPGATLPFDRKAVIREIWVSGSAVPNDADGTMLINALVRDISEAADDTIVSAVNLETVITVANRAFQLTLAAETDENELTVFPGDTLRFTLVNNSAAIDTNSNISVVVLVQYLDAIENAPSGL